MHHFLTLLLFVVFNLSNCDIYLHNPRGSNNRLNEGTATRTNANRLFDSQNNNRGGYNVGDSTSKAATNEKEQYQMVYYQSDASSKTRLIMEWTNQHGCGGHDVTDPHKQNCVIIIQYMCQPNTVSEPVWRRLRDGTATTNSPYDTPTKVGEYMSASRRNKVTIQTGLHESWNYYENCYFRERNKGLFTADQKLKSSKLGYSGAIYTRQNPNGNRYGYECPEEKDYFPYWHPSAWNDVAILTDNTTMCPWYLSETSNNKAKHSCVAKDRKALIPKANNAQSCLESGGEWLPLYSYMEKVKGVTTKDQCIRKRSQSLNYVWGIPHDAEAFVESCLLLAPIPVCEKAPWTRSNHLGNARSSNKQKAEAPNFVWQLPYFPSGVEQRCVLRIRYNISTSDYDPWSTDAKHNDNKRNGISSPVKQNPLVDVGDGPSLLRLAINTAQFGRVFQDRSHVFLLKPRPANLRGSTIHNLNIRGKRGNIVQVYPAVEYDFIPNDLVIPSRDLVHVQWAGSNTHSNRAPGGDGQVNADGAPNNQNGATDRNNLVQIPSLNENFALPFETSTMFSGIEVLVLNGSTSGFSGITDEDIALNLASSGYYRCVKCSHPLSAVTLRNSPPGEVLQKAAPSFGGVVLRFKSGEYFYMSSVNSNFSNRTQKGRLKVT